MSRAFVIIIDGVGIGELPDAAKYGDEGSDTLGNLAHAVGGLSLPNLEMLGLGCIHRIDGLDCAKNPAGCFGKMAEKSPGKDSTTGHWELAGLELANSFPTYPNGFPSEIIKELGEEHLRSRKPIIYTSADSVFQIAAHEDVIPLKELYEICQISRILLTGEHSVARVIARPFTGENADSFIRTKYRKDFSLKPFGKTILTILQDNNIRTIGIGKINELYASQGIDVNIHAKQNSEGMKALENAVDEYNDGLIMANLVDFDMLWGHRNDVQGFKKSLEEFDYWLGSFLKHLQDNDILFITSDHGNDPTTPGTDHSREYVPILVFGGRVKNAINLGVRNTFADLHATLAGYFGVKQNNCGDSFPDVILNNFVS